MINRRQKGRQAEQIAAEFLKNKQYTITEQNYHMGRLGELDLIVENEDYLVFVEVKSSFTDDFGNPVYKLNRKKQRQIAKMAEFYLAKFPQEKEFRFDAIIIQFSSGQTHITHYEDAFRL